jgi:hypothetical protein
MKLYHGTSSRNIERIKREGLKPRGKRVGNWKQSLPSRADVVYLTNSYAVFYANACTRGNEDLVVLEIDTDELNPFAFGPDEDFLEQAQRGRDNIPGNMHKRTTWYRDNLKNYEGCLEQPGHAPMLSLQFLGNCVYFGSIHRKAITRIAVISISGAKEFVYQCFDPSIVLMNYKVCGTKYRNAMKWLFEEPLEPESGLVDFRIPANRDGINLTLMDRPLIINEEST